MTEEPWGWDRLCGGGLVYVTAMTLIRQNDAKLAVGRVIVFVQVLASAPILAIFCTDLVSPIVPCFVVPSDAPGGRPPARAKR